MPRDRTRDPASRTADPSAPSDRTATTFGLVLLWLLAGAILLTPAGASGTGMGAAAPDPVPAIGSDPILHWTTAPEGNEARYRVREQLARLDFPNDAVGVTPEVQGQIAFTSEGRIDASASLFTIGLAALASDSDRRDNFLRRNTLATGDHPEAVFRPREVRGLDLTSVLEAESENGAQARRVEFDMVGDLTIRETTRQVVWTVVADIGDGSVRGEARTAFTFGDFDLEIPRVGSVLSINDDIRLEYDFHLVPAG